jgi:hypothetical protein
MVRSSLGTSKALVNLFVEADLGFRQHSAQSSNFFKFSVCC